MDIKHENEDLRKAKPLGKPRAGWICRWLLFSFLIAMLQGCALFTRVEAPMVAPPQPTPTLEVCSEDIPGLSIRLLFGRRDEDGQRVTISGVGFEPGEHITVRVSVIGVSTTYTVESIDYPVQPDGTFSTLDVLPVNEPNMRWEARAIHQRGVACLRTAAPK